MAFFASAAKGTEEVLFDELRELRFSGLGLTNGGVYFQGTREDAWRACLWSRIAQRIFLRVVEFPAADDKAFYSGVRLFDWSRVLTAERTLAVSAFCRSAFTTHNDFLALKTKDAIVDQLRERFGARPSVSRTDADVDVFVRLVQDMATVYLDLAGDSLTRRGYRQVGHEAPLKETLAAAMLRLSGWDRQRPLLDPLCGSGTIPIEAAWWATATAPGLLRARFGFERWADFTDADREALADLCGRARRRARGQQPRITGADVDAEAIRAATVNARAAGVRISLKQAPLADLQAGGQPGIVITNPPYGQRLEADASLWRDMASAFARLHGWRVCVLAGSRDVARAVPFKPVAEHPLYNGDIECRFFVYDVP